MNKQSFESRIAITIITLLGLVGAAGVAHASRGGGMDSGGTDSRRLDFGAAWFLGDAPVSVCVDTAPGFGVSATDAVKKTEGAIAKWIAYIDAKRIDRESSSRNAALTLARDYRVKAGCRGGEDVAVYLGVENAVVKKAKADFENPTAFAYRLDYDLEKGRGHGLIWVAPAGGMVKDWSAGLRLDGILLHEFGHVFGNEHASDTIMEENMIHWLQYPELDVSAFYLGHIDHQRELARCLDCTERFEGVFGLPVSKEDPRQAQLFAKVMGRASVGKIKTSLVRVGSLATSESKFTWSVGDDLGTETFPVTNVTYSSTHLDNREFRRAKGTGLRNGITAEATGSQPVIGATFGTIAAKTGKLSVLIEENTGLLVNSPLNLSLVGSGIYALPGENKTPVFETLKPGINDRED